MQTGWTTIANRCVKEYKETVRNITNYCPNYLTNGMEPNILPIKLKSVTNFEEDKKKAYENSLQNHNNDKKKKYDSKRKEIILY